MVPVLFSQSASLASSPARGIAAIATSGYAGFLTGPPIVGGIAALSDLRVGIAALAVAATAAAVIAMALAPPERQPALGDEIGRPR